jgi:hypothetical protein
MKKLAKGIGWMFVGLFAIMLIAYVVVISYKKEILAAVNEKISESINGTVKIGDFNITLLHDFPNISLSLKDIYLQGPRHDQYKRDFLRAEVIDVNVEALKLFQKQLSIKSIDVRNGDVFIFRTKSGYINLDIFKKSSNNDTTRSSTGSGPTVSFEKMNLKNVSIAFHDSLKEKLFGATFMDIENKILSTDSSMRAHMTGSIDFQQLTFNASKGSFLENKHTDADLNVEFFFPSRRLVIEHSTLDMDKSRINLSGDMRFLLPGGNFHFNIQSDPLDYREGLEVVSERLRNKLSKFTIEKPVAINVQMNGEMGSERQPAVDISFRVDDSQVMWNKLKLKKAFVQGSFTNHKDSLLDFDDINSQVKLDSIHAEIKSLPFKGIITFNDLRDPFMNLDVKFEADLKKLNADLDTTRLRFTSGHFTSKVLFAGKLSEYLDETITKYHGTLLGETEIKDGRISYVEKKIVFDRLNASFHFTDKKFDIDRIGMRMNKNPIYLTGSITGFVPFFLEPEKQGKVFLKMNSPSLDFTGVAGAPAKSEFDVETARNKKKISDMIDRIYEKLEFEIDFTVNKIKSKEVIGTGLTGKIVLANNKLQARSVKMNMAKGQVEFSATLNDLQKDVNPFALKAEVRNAGIKEFFHMFNDFNQKTIRSEHIDGKLFADIDVTAEINDNFEVLMPRLKGNVRFNVVDGHIKDFEPLENMSNFLMKKRDFTDVQFGEIKASFDIRGSELDVSRMEIESTVLTLFLEGRYSLKDSTNLHIQVPLSNLKKRDQDFAPENVGTDTKVGLSVRLRAYQGKDGKTVIAFAPFDKKEKDKHGRRN